MSKKGSKAPKEVSTYEPNDIVLGKVRGYPAWPGQVSLSRPAISPFHLEAKRTDISNLFFISMSCFDNLAILGGRP